MKFQKFYTLFGKPVTNEAEIRPLRRDDSKCSLFLAAQFNPVEERLHAIEDENGNVTIEQAQQILSENGFLPVEKWLDPKGGDQLPAGVNDDYRKALSNWSAPE